MGPTLADRTIVALPQKLDATRAQLAAAVQDVAAAKASLGATERYLLSHMQRIPNLPTQPILPPKQQKPISSAGPPKQQQQQGVSAVPEQPSRAEPQRVAAQVPEPQQMARSTASVEACQAVTNQQQVKAGGSPPAAPAAQDDEQGAAEQRVTPPVAAGSPVTALSPRESVDSDSDSSNSSSILTTVWGHFTDAASKVAAFDWSGVMNAPPEYVPGAW